MIQRLNTLCGMENYSEANWLELLATYLAQCAMIDELFGMVCDALKEAGEYDDTAIFFLSDHGDYGLPEKCQNSFENCLTKVPLLIKPPTGETIDPGVAKGLTELVDFYATVMDYAAVEPNHTQFGKSLRPVIEDRRQHIRDYVFCEGGRNAGEVHCDVFHESGPEGTPVHSVYWPRMRAQTEDETHEKGTMIFDGKYKYIHRISGENEFYDLSSDHGECINIIQQVSEEQLAKYRIWAACRVFCPEEKEADVKSAIRAGMRMQEAIEYCFNLCKEN